MTESDAPPEAALPPMQSESITEAPREIPRSGYMRREVLRLDPVRETTSQRVLAQVRSNPGITIRKVALALGFSHATCSYHLQSLVRNGVASRINDGRDVRFFPAGQYSVANHLRVIVADFSKLAVARFIVRSAEELPGLTINEVAKRLQLPFGFVKRTLLQFERVGFVYMSRRGARYAVCPVPHAMTREVLALIDGVAAPLR
ncbi:MAG: winged helix-turn-helix transcriptional regulator [Thermoplasmatota archaeon]